MSDEDGELYKYTVPLEKDGNTSSPKYSPTFGESVAVCRYKNDVLVLVQDESIPHFHKDSMDVSVEKVNEEDYR